MDKVTELIIEKLKNTKLNMIEISNEIGVEYYKVVDVNKLYTIRPHHKKLTDEIVNMVISDLKTTKLSMREIGMKYDLSDSSISVINRKFGVRYNGINVLEKSTKNKIENLLRSSTKTISEIADETKTSYTTVDRYNRENGIRHTNGCKIMDRNILSLLRNGDIPIYVILKLMNINIQKLRRLNKEYHVREGVIKLESKDIRPDISKIATLLETGTTPMHLIASRLGIHVTEVIIVNKLHAIRCQHNLSKLILPEFEQDVAYLLRNTSLTLDCISLLLDISRNAISQINMKYHIRLSNKRIEIPVNKKRKIINALRFTNLSQNNIALDNKVSVSTVSRINIEYNIRNKQVVMNETEKKIIKLLTTTDYTQYQIAEKLGVSRSIVSRIKLKCKVKRK